MALKMKNRWTRHFQRTVVESVSGRCDAISSFTSLSLSQFKSASTLSWNEHLETLQARLALYHLLSVSGKGLAMALGINATVKACAG